MYFSGAPVYLSFPHFYNADPKLKDAVVGLNPKQDLHESYFKIQPVSSFIIHETWKFKTGALHSNST